MHLRQTLSTALLVLCGVFYIVAGVNHFLDESFYLKLMPPYLPAHRLLVQVSGVAEVLLGVLLLVPRTRRLAAWGIVALLVAVFPANIHAFLHQEVLPAPAWAHLLRLPMQGVLIAWAWWYTRASVNQRP